MKSITFRVELLENMVVSYTHEFKNPRIISACIYLLCLKHIGYKTISKHLYQIKNYIPHLWNSIIPICKAPNLV